MTMRRGTNALRAASVLCALLLLPMAPPAQAAGGTLANAPALTVSAGNLADTAKEPEPGTKKKEKAKKKEKFTPYTPSELDRAQLPDLSGTRKVEPPKTRRLDRTPDGFLNLPQQPKVAPTTDPGTNTVVGKLEEAILEAGGRIRVKGWAADTYSPSRTVQVIGGTSGQAQVTSRANTTRPGTPYGDAHGFDFDVEIPPTRGLHQVCVSAFYTTTKFTDLGCLEFDSRAFGAIEYRIPLAVVESGAYSVIGGWMIDPYTASYATFSGFRDKQEFFRGYSAALPRPDIAQAFPTFGPNHGWEVWIKHDGLEGTPSELCVNADSGGVGKQLGCMTQNSRHDPFGALDEVRWQGENILVKGWAIDPDTRSPVEVSIFADGKLVKTASAFQLRTDIRDAHPEYGDSHGFETTIPAAFDDQKITVKPTNIGRAGPLGGNVEWKMNYDGSSGPCRCIGENFEAGSYDKTAYSSWGVDHSMWITSDKSHVVSGTYSAYGQSLPNGEWTEFLISNRAKMKLKRSTTYTVTYRYRILGPANSQVEHYFLARTTSGGYGNDWWGGMLTDSTGSGVKSRSVTFTTGAFDDYYLIWGIHNSGAMTVDNIVVNGPVG